MTTPAQAQWVVVRRARPALSFRLDRRVPLALAVLTIIALVGIVLNIGVGEYPVSPVDVVRVIVGLPTANPDNVFVVHVLRAPRVTAAFLAGVLLALSGAIMQSITRNALASPELTGVTAGASLVAVIVIMGVPGLPRGWLPVAASAGGLAAAFLIYALAWRRHDSPMRLILVGIGLMSVTYAVTEVMIVFAEIWEVARAMTWLSGSVYGRGWADVRLALPWIVLGVPLALLQAREMNALHLGDEVAGGLGSRVSRSRLLLLTTAAVLAGVAVLLAGALGFVGLIAPHISRRLVGPSHEGLLPVAAVAGGALVVFSDLVGRTVLAPAEIPVGIVVAVIGVPFFLWLLYQSSRR